MPPQAPQPITRRIVQAIEIADQHDQCTRPRHTQQSVQRRREIFGRLRWRLADQLLADPRHLLDQRADQAHHTAATAGRRQFAMAIGRRQHGTDAIAMTGHGPGQQRGCLGRQFHLQALAAAKVH